MRLRYSLSNYRCFPDSRRAELLIEPGFTSFVGANNAGKSTLLRSIYELRPFFERLANGHGPFFGEGAPNELPLQGVSDAQEVFNDRNDRPLAISLSPEVHEPRAVSRCPTG